MDAAISGRPAVRFNGRTTQLITTTPFSTAADQTVIVVFAAAPAALARPTAAQILNYGSNPNIVLETYEHRVHGRLYTGEDNIARLASPRLAAGEAVIAGYVYGPTSGKVQLWLNGRLCSRESTTHPAQGKSPKYLGAHPGRGAPSFFSGDVAELLIYDRSLSADELGRVTRYLGEKYLLTVAAPALDSSPAKVD